MKQRWIKIRNSIIALGFLGTLGVGAARAASSFEPSQANIGPCDSASCAAECGTLGGRRLGATCLCCG